MTTLLILFAAVALAPVLALWLAMLCALVLASKTRQEQEQRDGTLGG